MKILAFDTAMQSCSVALTEDARLLAEVNLVTTETHSRHLAGLIRDVCRMAGSKLSDIDGYAVTRGPGSFTGLRIGISTALGLAQASGKPIAGVSTLKALATQAAVPSQLVCPMIDARRGEVYVAVLRFTKHGLVSQRPEQVLMPENAIETIGEPCIFVGSGATLYNAKIKEILGEMAHFTSEMNHTIRAATVASLARKRLSGGEADDIMHFSPTYLRRPDAETNTIVRQKASI